MTDILETDCTNFNVVASDTAGFPTFVKPLGIDFSFHSALHRHPHHVVLATNAGGEFKHVCSILAQQQTRYGGGMAQYLTVDSYASINGFWGNPKNVSKYKVGPAELLRATRKEKHLQYINAVYADLDCYSMGLTTGQVVGELLDMQDRREIPPISALLRSGRGVWVFWMMCGNRDGEAHMSQRATKIAIPWAKLIQRKINEKLACLGADPNATDLCRVCRIPGSINSKADDCDQIVDYWLRRNPDGGGIATYTLEQLGEWFNAPMPDVKPGVSTGKSLKGGQNAAMTGRLRWERDYERLLKLLHHRGIIPEGQRAATVYLAVRLLRGLGYDGAELRAKAEIVWSFIQHCAGIKQVERNGKVGSRNRDYTRREFDAQVGIVNLNPPSHRRIANMLKITPEESILTEWPIAGAEPKLSRTEVAVLRRAWLRGKCQQHDELPSVRRLAELLPEYDCRLKSGKDAIANDLKLIKAEKGSIHQSK